MTRQQISMIKALILAGFKAAQEHEDNTGPLPVLPEFTNGEILAIIEYLEQLEKRMKKLKENK